MMDSMADGLDLLELLQADHAALGRLDDISRIELAVAKHLTTERELFYPLVAERRICSDEELEELRQLDRGLEEAVVQALKNPAVGKTDVIEALARHVSVQEALFELVRDEVGHDTLVRLGDRVEAVMMGAPRQIHLRLPDHGLLTGDLATLAEFADEFEGDHGRTHPDSSEGRS
jgi:hypothetical protein